MTIDHIFVARILFTLMTAAWSLLTVFADFNKTHATNPKWTPHSRFHVVWQISSYVGLGVIAFAVIFWWLGLLAVERLYLVLLMGAMVYAGFFAALIIMSIYGGAAYDDNGYEAIQGADPDHLENLECQHHRIFDPAGGSCGQRAGVDWRRHQLSAA